MTADVVVIGAGVAGLCAAVHLSAAGRTVVVLEEAPRLGGRATAFTDRETGERVDNGQHVLFGCYRETYDFLRQIGAADLAPLDATLALTMASSDGRQFPLTCPSWPPPWHLIAGVLRWPALGIGDRFSAARIGPVLRDVRRRGAAAVAASVPASMTVTDWLVSMRQTPRIREWLWDPLAIAALNQSPDVAAAAPFVRVLGEMFGPRATDSAIGLPRVPLDDLYAEPARRFIARAGGSVVVRASARIILDAGGDVAGVRYGDTTIATRVVVSSVPWHAFARIWAGDVPGVLRPMAADAAALGSSPIVTVNLWFDGPVMRHRFVGLVGGPMHWVFDKSAILSEPAGHLSVVASGADDLAAMDNAAVTRAVTDQLARALPDMRARTLTRAVVVREHRASFSLAPGSPARPATVTPIRGFFMAGDWVDTGLPGTIESAALSGRLAAEALLAAP